MSYEVRVVGRKSSEATMSGKKEELMPNMLKTFSLIPLFLLLTHSALAHHSRSIFDQQRTVTIEGTVTRYEWGNPHVHVFVETESDSREAVVWAFESGTTTMMRGLGWTKDMLAVGDRVIVEGHPVRFAGRTTAEVVTIQKGGITLVNSDLEAVGIEGDGQDAPRAESLNGTWYVYSLTEARRFNNLDNWSLTAKARDAVAAYDDLSMNPQNECGARTSPWLMAFPGVQKIDVGDEVVSIRTEYDTVDRLVHMDQDSHDGADYSYQGHSIGWWEGEVLVVDTAKFSDHRIGNARGVPSGPQKHLVERFQVNPDGRSLTYSFVLADPEYLSAPYTDAVQSEYRPELGFDPIECDLDFARRFIDQ